MNLSSSAYSLEHSLYRDWTIDLSLQAAIHQLNYLAKCPHSHIRWIVRYLLEWRLSLR